jgi:hypothetical protein
MTSLDGEGATSQYFSYLSRARWQKCKWCFESECCATSLLEYVLLTTRRCATENNIRRTPETCETRAQLRKRLKDEEQYLFVRRNGSTTVKTRRARWQWKREEIAGPHADGVDHESSARVLTRTMSKTICHSPGKVAEERKRNECYLFSKHYIHDNYMEQAAAHISTHISITHSHMYIKNCIRSRWCRIKRCIYFIERLMYASRTVPAFEQLCSLTDG